MFRTKSLSNKEMKTLIDRNRPRQIYKENRNHSLRSLIADKTIKYHKHMQKLVQDVNDSFLISSNKKPNKNQYTSPSKMLKDVSNCKQQSSGIRQFCPFESVNQILSNGNGKQEDGQVQYIVVESMPTYVNEEKIEEESYDQDFSCLLQSKKESESKSAFRVTLQNQQLNDENRELRRQIEYLQQRLETAELIKIQKQSQSQSLRLKIKIMQLKIQDYKQNMDQRNSYFNRFTKSRPKSISISLIQHKQMEIQTIDTLQKLQNIIKLNDDQRKQLCIIRPELYKIKQLVDSLIGQHDASQKQPTASTYNKLVYLISSNKIQREQLVNKCVDQIAQLRSINNTQREQLQNAHQAQLQQLVNMKKIEKEEYEVRLNNEKQKYTQLEHRYKEKVNNLMNLLGLAQQEIRVLLARLREAKDADVANYKQLITQHHRPPYTQLNRMELQDPLPE